MNLKIQFIQMKKFAFIFILLTMVGCNSKQTNSSQTEQSVKTVKKLFDNFNQHDWQAMASLYADDAQFKDPSLGQTVIVQNRAQIQEKYRALNALFTDITDSIDQLYTSDEHTVIVEFVSKGTAPDSTTFRLPICSIFTIQDGQIIKDFTYYDNSN